MMMTLRAGGVVQCWWCWWCWCVTVVTPLPQSQSSLIRQPAISTCHLSQPASQPASQQASQPASKPFVRQTVRHPSRPLTLPTYQRRRTEGRNEATPTPTPQQRCCLSSLQISEVGGLPK
ncbi:hypothetical protein B0T13DRAFT_248825 [Neurospora crassa]|nr:hypothetical protein B0T13DRAFT_248825 [Neurospora crassa]